MGLLEDTLTVFLRFAHAFLTFVWEGIDTCERLDVCISFCSQQSSSQQNSLCIYIGLLVILCCLARPSGCLRQQLTIDGRGARCRTRCLAPCFLAAHLTPA